MRDETGFKEYKNDGFPRSQFFSQHNSYFLTRVIQMYSKRLHNQRVQCQTAAHAHRIVSIFYFFSTNTYIHNIYQFNIYYIIYTYIGRFSLQYTFLLFFSFFFSSRLVLYRVIWIWANILFSIHQTGV